MPESAPRICPECGHAMTPHTSGDLRLDLCESCGGVWYDAGVFAKMIHEGPHAIDEVEAEEPSALQKVEARKAHDCPVDLAPLNRYHYAATKDIELSGCPQCGGIFIERADLDKLDTRQHKLTVGDPGYKPDPKVAECMAIMDGQLAADVFKSRMAQYNWGLLMTPNWW